MTIFTFPQRRPFYQSLAWSGFTLIEILLTVAIIGILSTVVLVAINPSQRVQAAYDSQHKADIAQVRNSLEAYATANNGKYPSTGGVFTCDDCGASDTPNTTYGPDDWIPSLVTQGFIKHLPKDPLNGMAPSGNCTVGSSYGYVYVSNGDDYKLMAYCTVKSNLNDDASQTTTTSSYCPVAGSFDDASFIASPSGISTLQSLVDPKRPKTGYAVYSKGYTCK
jgi:prepilin-type N-terminal cleavage/methylation domain-containing protein